MATAQFRASAPLFDTRTIEGPPPPSLGCLKELPGTWTGEGFNIVLLPDFQNQKPFQVKLERTSEILEFRAIGATIPNRGNVQNDIEFLGVHYLQRINDANDHSALHLEPGIWLNLPQTTSPAEAPTIVRQAAIPHGDSLLATGNCVVVQTGPKIAAEDTTPLDAVTGAPITDPNYLATLKGSPLPKGLTNPGIIMNPNLVIEDAIKGQKIVETTVLVVSTTNSGGILNIPFINTNATAVQMSAIFWIEKVESPDGRLFLQLQYTQRVILKFNNINWPHISVATLIKR